MVALYLEELHEAAPLEPNGQGGLEAFIRRPQVSMLGWPTEVIKQWLWEHRENDAFLHDYAEVDLSRIRWTLESIPATELKHLPTGPSDGDCIEDYAHNHQHYLRLRQRYQPLVVDAWESEGTWLVPPILISRLLLRPPAAGLQVIEGRTRVGLLRGRLRSQLLVAEHHRAWVGRLAC